MLKGFARANAYEVNGYDIWVHIIEAYLGQYTNKSLQNLAIPLDRDRANCVPGCGALGFVHAMARFEIAGDPALFNSNFIPICHTQLRDQEARNFEIGR